MDKYKIVALFGEAGAGKDYLQKQIIKTIWGKTNLYPIISCTTRPPREGEKDGIDYHFMPTTADFLTWENMGKWIEFTWFRNWWYGTSTDNLSKDKINIGVFNISGISQLLDNKEVECLPIRILCPDRTRLSRQLNRENSPDCSEICRRFLTDKEDFLNIPFEYKGIENNTNEIQPVINELIPIITHWSNTIN